MSVPCGIFSHYLKLLLCVLKFQNPSNAPLLGPETKDAENTGRDVPLPHRLSLLSIIHIRVFVIHAPTPFSSIYEEDWLCRAFKNLTQL